MKIEIHFNKEPKRGMFVSSILSKDGHQNVETFDIPTRNSFSFHIRDILWVINSILRGKNPAFNDIQDAPDTGPS